LCVWVRETDFDDVGGGVTNTGLWGRDTAGWGCQSCTDECWLLCGLYKLTPLPPLPLRRHIAVADYGNDRVSVFRTEDGGFASHMGSQAQGVYAPYVGQTCLTECGRLPVVLSSGDCLWRKWVASAGALYTDSVAWGFEMCVRWDFRWLCRYDVEECQGGFLVASYGSNCIMKLPFNGAPSRLGRYGAHAHRHGHPRNHPHAHTHTRAHWHMPRHKQA
jgi:hypothetical protein